ncbi:MAG: isochorismatase family protein [Anaerohalosphaeraceae bacterium]
MIRPALTLRRRRVLLDVDIQHDLFLADGKACVRNHRRVLANIRRAMAWTRRERIRQISLGMVHDPEHHDSGSHNGQYCVVGTEGVRKLHYTLRKRHADFGDDAGTDLPRQLLQDYEQVILYRHTEDPFEQPRIDRLLSETRATEFVVIGGTIEGAIKMLVLGLLIRRRAVTLLTDALGCHDKNAAEVALRQMHAKGAKLTDSKTLFGASHLRMVYACSCDRCRGKLQQKVGAEESAL